LSFVERTVASGVRIGRKQFQIAVVTFSHRAALDVQLRARNLSEIRASLPRSAGGRKSNLRHGLRVARTRAFGVDAGARPLAYRAAVVIFDGRAPDREFGTPFDEAPRLKTELGVDVHVIVSDGHEFAARSLLEAVASPPYSSHIRTSSSSRTVEDAVASILVNIQLGCRRYMAELSPGESPTTSSPYSSYPVTPPSREPPTLHTYTRHTGSTRSPITSIPPTRTVTPPNAAALAAVPRTMPSTPGPPKMPPTPGPPRRAVDSTTTTHSAPPGPLPGPATTQPSTRGKYIDHFTVYFVRWPYAIIKMRVQRPPVIACMLLLHHLYSIV